MSGWNNLPTDAQADSNWENYMEVLAEPIVEPPKPMEKTVMIDLATESEKPKFYVPEEGSPKPFEERKAEGVQMAPPVDIYEPGFRSDMYEAMLNYFKNKAETRKKHDLLKEKMGWRS